MNEITLKIIAATLATIAIATSQYGPKKELLYTGFTGGLTYATYAISIEFGVLDIIAVTLSGIVLTTISRLLAFNRRVPVTVILAPSFIPMAPGSLIYYTMSHLLEGNNALALNSFQNAFSRACFISLGMAIVYIFPHSFFKVKIPFVIKK